MKRLLLGLLLLFTQDATAQAPADEALMRWEGRINATRTDRLLALAPTALPDCDIAASKEEIAEFYAFWRLVVQEEIDLRNAMGAAIDNPNEEAQRSQMKQIGLTFIPQYHLSELTHVSPTMPHADESVVRQIEIWKALHCVVEKYGASKFSSNNGSSKMSMDWPFDPILSAFGYDSIPIDPDKTKAYLLPNMLDLEPLDALGRFFRAAEARGDLKFENEDAEKYFFLRYEGDYFYDMTDVSKARAWFHTPPWNPDAPHLERPTRPIPSHSEK